MKLHLTPAFTFPHHPVLHPLSPKNQLEAMSRWGGGAEKGGELLRLLPPTVASGEPTACCKQDGLHEYMHRRRGFQPPPPLCV